MLVMLELLPEDNEQWPVSVDFAEHLDHEIKIHFEGQSTMATNKDHPNCAAQNGKRKKQSLLSLTNQDGPKSVNSHYVAQLGRIVPENDGLH